MITEKCRPMLDRAFEKLTLHTSDYIINEYISVAWNKPRRVSKAFRFSLVQHADHDIQGRKVRVLKVNEEDFSAAKAYLRKYPRVIPTLTDWTSLVLMARNDIWTILSLDHDFDRVRRIAEFRRVRRISDTDQM